MRKASRLAINPKLSKIEGKAKLQQYVETLLTLENGNKTNQLLKIIPSEELSFGVLFINGFSETLQDFGKQGILEPGIKMLSKALAKLKEGDWLSERAAGEIEKTLIEQLAGRPKIKGYIVSKELKRVFMTGGRYRRNPALTFYILRWIQQIKKKTGTYKYGLIADFLLEQGFVNENGITEDAIKKIYKRESAAGKLSELSNLSTIINQLPFNHELLTKKIKEMLTASE